MTLRHHWKKFGNVRTPCAQGKSHASKAEAWRCDELHMLQRTGVIFNLQAHPQPRYPLAIFGSLICNYVADFAYNRSEGQQDAVIEDVKGVETPEFKIKKKLFEAIYRPVTITVVPTRR